MTFADMVTQSVFARALAIIVLALVMIAAIVVATFDLLTGRDINGTVTTILGIGIGTAGTMIGINFGIILQPLPAVNTSSVTASSNTTSSTGGATHVSNP